MQLHILDACAAVFTEALPSTAHCSLEVVSAQLGNQR